MLKFCLTLIALVASVGIAAAQESPVAPADEKTLVDSPFFKLGWPKIEMPKFSWKPGFGQSGDTAPVATPQQPGGNPVSRTLDKVADSSRRASQKVREAWGSAVERVSSFGRSDDTQRVASNEERPGFWSRLLAPEEPRRPETVQEFLAQDRVGTTR